jgi:hypothetical protein
MFSPSEIEDAELQELYHYWRRKHRGDRLPRRADIDPIEIPGLLKNIAILEVSDEAEDFVFALAGSRIEEVHGRALKGVSLRQLQAEFEVSPSVRRYHDAVNSREPQFQRASLKEFGKAHWSCRRLILPLSSDGERIDALLMGAVFSLVTDSDHDTWLSD